MQVLKSYTPLDHQLAAAKFLVGHKAAGIFMDIGWGKTASALSALRTLNLTGQVKKTLVITKKRICQLVWAREPKEWAEFSYMSVVFLHGKDKEKLLAQDHHIYCINPEGLQWLFMAKIINIQKFDLLIIDESTGFKHTNTKRFKTLRRHLGRFPRRWIMTGEPAPNGLMDLFGQIYILDFGKALGQYITHYRMEYFRPVGFRGYNWAPQVGAEERIYGKLQGLVCRPTADKKLKMPTVVMNKILIELPPKARTVYKGVEEDLRAMVKKDQLVAKNGAVATQQCRQVTGGAVYKNERNSNNDWLSIHDEKVEVIGELLEELSGKPLLVFYEFDHERQRLLERYSDVAVEFTNKDIEVVEKKWNAGEIRLLLAHPGSSGRGLNLQKSCSHACWFTLPWDLELYRQGIGRLARQGSAGGSVTIHHLVAKDTIDEYVEAVLVRKDRVQNDLKKALESIAFM